MSEQAPDQPEWFAYRTHVALRCDKPRFAGWLPHPSRVGGVVLCGLLTALVFVWLVSADLDAVLNVVGGLLRAFGTQDPPT